MKTKGKKTRASKHRAAKVERKFLQISDHAIVRYLERCMKVDTEPTRRRIIDMISGSVSKLGDGEYPIGEGESKAVVVNNVVVTIR